MKSTKQSNLLNNVASLFIVLALSWLLPAANAVAMPRSSQPADVPPIFVDAKKTATLQEALSRPEAKRLVYVGEMHTSYSDHQLQLRVLEAMHAQGGSLVLGVEWFQRPFQDVLDRYIAGEIDEATMLSETEYFSRWRFDYRLYRDILRFAREKGIRVLALNAGRELTNAVRKQGLDGMPAELRKRLPADYDFENPSYEEQLKAVFQLHEKRFADDEKAFKRFLEVQMTWDETMAETTARYLNADPEGRILVLAGRGHTHRAAIPKRVTRRTGLPGLTIATYQPGATFESPDFIVLQPPQQLPPKGLIGVGLEERKGGVFITSIAEASNAGEAGIRKGDRLVSIEDKFIDTYADVQIAMTGRSPGEKILLKVHREGFFGLSEDQDLEVTLVSPGPGH